DMVATSADLVGVPVPARTDGISFLPTLLDHPKEQKQHDYFYWELGQAKGGFQEIRLNHWKAERLNVSESQEPVIELYDLQSDIGQKQNVAAEHPEVIKRIEQIAKEAHTPNTMFPLTYDESQSAKPKGAPKKSKRSK